MNKKQKRFFIIASIMFILAFIVVWNSFFNSSFSIPWSNPLTYVILFIYVAVMGFLFAKAKRAE